MRDTLNGDKLLLYRIHPFPARMAPSVVNDILQKLSGRKVVLDPMAGSGTTLAIAARLGHHAIGFDTDPMAVLLASSLDLRFDYKFVLKNARQLLLSAMKREKDMSYSEAYPPQADEETKAFVRFWFSRTSRKQLACLAREILSIENNTLRQVYWVAFSRLIIKKDKGVSFAKDVSHSRPHRCYDESPILPFDHFLGSVKKTSMGIQSLKILGKGSIVAKRGDAKMLPLSDNSVDLVITSPPYFNAIDYIRGHKLSLVWMAHNTQVLRKIRGSNIGAEVGLSEKHRDDRINRGLTHFGKIRSLSNRRVSLLAKYFSDMDMVLGELYRTIKHSGEAHIVIGDSNLNGVFIRNSAVIRYLAQDHGFKVCGIRKRKIEDSRRYLPPPSLAENNTFGSRMREEIILSLGK